MVKIILAQQISISVDIAMAHKKCFDFQAVAERRRLMIERAEDEMKINALDDDSYAELKALDVLKLTRWLNKYQKRVGSKPGAEFLPGHMIHPYEAIKRKVEFEKMIKNGQKLYIVGIKLRRCELCGFGNPVDGKKSCLACKEVMSDQIELRKPYSMNVELCYDMWECKDGHYNDLQEWNCSKRQCRNNMWSSNSKVIKLNVYDEEDKDKDSVDDFLNFLFD